MKAWKGLESTDFVAYCFPQVYIVAWLAWLETSSVLQRGETSSKCPSFWSLNISSAAFFTGYPLHPSSPLLLDKVVKKTQDLKMVSSQAPWGSVRTGQLVARSDPSTSLSSQDSERGRVNPRSQKKRDGYHPLIKAELALLTV